MSPTGTRSGFMHLLVVYAVWGSTFIAIRVAVQPGSGFPPFTLSAMRVLAGGVLLYALVRVAGAPRPERRALLGLATSGVALWAGGLAALLYGAQRADSGYAAVVFGTTPLWSLVLESIKARRRPSMLVALSTALGFIGIIVLTLPSLLANAADPSRGLDPWSAAALLVAPIGWAIGSTLQTEEAKAVPALTSAAYQQLFGGIACALLALLLERPAFEASTEAWLGFAYLLIPGCIPAFTSYVRALQLLPASTVMSFAYVNPVIAVLLGALVLDEQITGWMLAGMATLLIGVAGVLRGRTESEV